MKLNQLGLSPAGQKATRRLKHQVQKSGVAANRESSVKLGVIGVTLGQQQSTGDTSITEATASGNHEKLIRSMCEMMGYSREIKLNPSIISAALQTVIHDGRRVDGEHNRKLSILHNASTWADLLHRRLAESNSTVRKIAENFLQEVLHDSSIHLLFNEKFIADLNSYEDFYRDVGSLRMLLISAMEYKGEDMKLMHVALSKLGLKPLEPLK